jgi:hypothetical protein
MDGAERQEIWGKKLCFSDDISAIDFLSICADRRTLL